MPVSSADSLLLSAVEETVAGTTPTSPAFETWRTTGESLVFSPNTSESAELGGTGRTARPSNVTGMSVSGDINFPLAKFDALEQAIAGVFASEYGVCPLTGVAGGAIDSVNRVTVGEDLKTFTIEKRFPNAANVNGATPMTLGAVGAPGAAVTLTFATDNTGSGVAVIDVVIDAGETKRFNIPLPAATTAIAAGGIAQTILNADAEITAVDNLDGTVDLTTSGTQFDSVVTRIGADSYYYQRLAGVSYSVLSLSVAPNEDITGSVTVLGGTPALDELPLAGATYTAPAENAIFTAPEVLAVTIGSMGVSSHCWTSLELTFDSANRAISCIGTLGEREVVLGTMAVSVSGDVYFSDQQILEALLANETLGDGVITFTNTDDEIFRFDIYGLKPVSGELAAGGTGEDLTMPVELEPTPVEVCNDGGSGVWKSSVIMSLEDTAPTLP